MEWIMYVFQGKVEVWDMGFHFHFNFIAWLPSGPF